ncbi:ATP-binding protein [Parvularcula sp. LCG005]|uniref:ATP-binding protein n=1 Tax=Parvularcula sp. LCG005 TaxID=3078805 RepID=UPI002943D425|nr:ATP-binding protein [Parvularcula sp. LCG005]WOI52884.1 ATP-binding protein [Parvularcula sp. LCG005]
MATPKQQQGDAPPVERSRVGDFAFCAAVGLMSIISGLMLSGAGPAPISIICILFLGALGVRYFALRDAQTVRPGLDFSEEEVAALKRLRVLIDTFPQPVLLLTHEGQVETANAAAHRHFTEDVTGYHISGLIRSPRAHDCLRDAHHTGKPCEVEFTTNTVPERTLLFYAAPIAGSRHSSGRGTIIMLRDRTAQKKLERMRTDFVANASHELRTPLASMSGFIETLQGHAKDDPEARERFLKVMASQVERMLRLVEDLIGLSAIEINEAKPPSDQVNLVTIVESVQENLLPLAAKEGVEIKVLPPAEASDAIIIGDASELFRLILNLCDNALKYGIQPDRDHNSVVLALGRGIPPEMPEAYRAGETSSHVAARAGIGEQEIVWVQIRDTGPGISRGDLPRLTERFYRVNPELSKAKGGTGLGLAIVKHILQRHRASLQIETREGEGTVFTCLFLGPAAWTRRTRSTPQLDERT